MSKTLLFGVLLTVALFGLTVNANKLKVAVNNVVTTQNDEYVCQTHELNDENIYVTDFMPELNRSAVHHVLIYGCKVAQAGTRRNCYVPCDWSPSGGGSRILYAWASETPEFKLPQDVSFQLGANSGWNYLVIQVHYKDTFKTPDSSGIVLTYQTRKTRYTAGIYLFASTLFRIQPHKTDVRAIMKCTMELEQPYYIFAVRVHTHALGRAVGVFTLNKGKWQTIIERSPQRAQAFIPLETPLRIDNGVDMAARCIYDSSDVDHPVGMGSTRNDEMCNAYVMFYTEDLSFTYSTCDDPSPAILLPEPSTVELNYKNENGNQGEYGHDNSSSQAAVAVASTSEDHKADKEKVIQPKEEKSDVPAGPQWKFTIQLDANWSSAMHSDRFPVIGQIGGVSKDDAGNIYIFHRGQRVWNDFSFDGAKHFAHKTEGPITENAVVVVAPNGTVIDAFGAGIFYMPHGITVCQWSNSIWLTDVALHQVFRYDFTTVRNRPDKTKFDIKPTLVLGEAFEPGKDESHLCQPTGVTTLRDGSAIIADGYCNSRLLSVSPSGKIARSISLKDKDVEAENVHAVIYDPYSKMILAADREKGRIFAVDQDSLNVSFVLVPSPTPTKIFALGLYQPSTCHPNVVVALNQSDSVEGKPGAFFFISPTERKVVDIVTFTNEIDDGHTMAIDSSNNWFLVGQTLGKWTPDALIRFHTSLVGACTGITNEGVNTFLSNLLQKNEQIYSWIQQSIQSPTSFIGLLVFLLSTVVVLIIAVLVCRMCRRRGSPNMRRGPRGATGRDYAAQYSLLVGDAAVKRGSGSGRKNNGFQDLETDDEEDDTIVDRRLVSRPPGGGAKSRFVGFPPENKLSPSRRIGEGDKIV